MVDDHPSSQKDATSRRHSLYSSSFDGHFPFMVISRRLVNLSYCYIMFSSSSRTAFGFVTRSCSRRRVASSSFSLRSTTIRPRQQQQSLLSTLLCPSAATTTTTTLTKHCQSSLSSVASRYYSTTTTTRTTTTATTMASAEGTAAAVVDEIIKTFPPSSLVGTDVPLAMQALIDADCVCFDVDSTVINEEGIVSTIDLQQREKLLQQKHCVCVRGDGAMRP